MLELAPRNRSMISERSQSHRLAGTPTMRQIGTLPDGDAARRLADYLLTLKIETRLDQQPEGWIVWVCDEDRVPQAREEFAEFARNPTDARFARASRTAHELRLREIEEDEDYRQRLTEL